MLKLKKKSSSVRFWIILLIIKIILLSIVYENFIKKCVHIYNIYAPFQDNAEFIDM